jgi:hypothetical protein
MTDRGYNSAGEIEPLVDFDLNAIEPDPDLKPRNDSHDLAGLEAIFALANWAGRSRARQFAVRIILRQEVRSVRDFSLEVGIARTTIHREIRNARGQLAHHLRKH